MLLACTNKWEKLTPMIIFNGKFTTLIKNLKPINSFIWFNGQDTTSYINREGYKLWFDKILIKFIINEKIFNLNLFLNNAGKWHIPYKEDIVSYNFFMPNKTHRI